MRLRIGHSPDPDDAFMVWALADGRLPLDGVDVELVPLDIQSLNRKARTGELEVTAISAGVTAPTEIPTGAYRRRRSTGPSRATTLSTSLSTLRRLPTRPM